jgi:DNA-binding NtrC family response regulator
MAAFALALTSDDTFRSVFEPRPEDVDVVVRRVDGPADAQQQIEASREIRLLILERDQVSQPARFVQRCRRIRPGLDILLLSPRVGEAVRAEYQALGVEILERGQPRDELWDELRRRLARLDLQLRVGLRGRSPRMHEILETVIQIGPTDIPVLITGPSGSGKERVANALYSVSKRAQGPFVAVNVGALSESVLESELFGHEKGAFTGAVARKAGVFERAHRGTLFLDEVGEMSAHMQVRLLRALESGEITPVGGTRSLLVDARILAATNQVLETAVHKGTFREDLYYRLKVVHIEMPSLAERREDIHELVQHFLAESAQQYGTRVRAVSDGALRALQDYAWPGNVRELRNVVQRMAVLAKSARLEESDIPAELRVPPLETQLPVPIHQSRDQAERDIILQSLLALRHDLQEVLRIMRAQDTGSAALVVEPDDPGSDAGDQNLRQREKELIRAALEAVGGNRRLAAQRLGIAERTLYRKIKEYSLS